MSTMSSPGIGSGLDVNSLVSRLVANERFATDNRLNIKERSLTSKISVAGQLKSNASSLSNSIANLSSIVSKENFKVSSSDNKMITGTISGSTSPGKYEVEIISTAKNQQSRTSALSSGITFGAGDLSISYGGSSVNVSVSSGDTLEKVRDSINNEFKGSLKASIVRGDAGSFLVVDSVQPGIENSFSISASGDASLNVFSSSNLTTRSAENAQVKINGVSVSSSSNIIKSAVDGLEFNLVNGASGVFELSVEKDNQAVVSAINDFVKQYNNNITNLNNVSKSDPQNNQVGVLQGQSFVRNAIGDLRNSISNSISDLKELGVQTNKDGTLTFDSAKFNKKIEENPNFLSEKFSESSFALNKVKERMDAFSDNNNGVGQFSKNLESQLKQIKKEKESFDVKMSLIEQRYLKQFSQLDGLISQMQSTSQFLSQQLSQLPK